MIWKTFFLKNHTQNVVEKLLPDPQNWGYLWINSLKFYSVEDYQNIFKLSCRPLAFDSYEAFWKEKQRSGTSFPASFFAWFLKKNISLVYSFCLVVFTSWDIGQYVYCNCFWRHKSSRFFCMPKKSRQKFKYLENKKSF